MLQLGSPNNAILMACTPVFNLLTNIQQDKQPITPDLYQDVVQAFDAVERLAQIHFITDAELVEINTCLAILIDDILQCKQALSSASTVALWPISHLQSTLFGYDNAEPVFFERLDILLKNAKNKLNLIELYSICLALGFNAKYPDQGSLSRLKIRIHQEIIRIRGKANRCLSLGCQQDQLVVIQKTTPWSLLTMIISAVVLFFMSFFIIEYLLRTEIQNHYYYVKEQVQLLINIVSEGRQ